MLVGVAALTAVLTLDGGRLAWTASTRASPLFFDIVLERSLDQQSIALGLLVGGPIEPIPSH